MSSWEGRGNCITDCALEYDAVLGRSGSEGRLVAVLLADPLSTEPEGEKEQWVKEILTWSSSCSSSSSSASSSKDAGGAAGDGGGRALLIRYVSIKLPKNKREKRKENGTTPGHFSNSHKEEGCVFPFLPFPAARPSHIIFIIILLLFLLCLLSLYGSAGLTG